MVIEYKLQQRRGGFSPPASVTRAIGRGKPAPTLLQLIFKRHVRVHYTMPRQVSKVRTTSSPDFSLPRFQSAVNFIGGAALFNQITPISNPQGQGLPTTRCAAFIINLLIWVGLSISPSLWPNSSLVQASAGARRAAQIAQETDSLEPGKPIERELSGAQSHSYKITMISGQYLHVLVAQRGIDVAVARCAPDGKKISEVDSEHQVEGSETVSAIAEAPGAYLIEVRSVEKTAKAGRYGIKVEELRTATAEDKYRVAGELIFREAERLQNGTPEAKRKSIEKYQEALELYRRASDRRMEVQTLINIGEVYRLQGEMQKALEKYNEALPISQVVGDRRGQAEALNNMGSVYWSQGEMRKALEKYDEALPIVRAVGDRRGEAIMLNNMGSVYSFLGEMRKALDKYDEALPIRRAIADRRGEANTLNNIADVYRLQGEAQKALEKCNEALPIYRAVGDRRGEAIALNKIGMAYLSLGETRKALEKYHETLPITRAVGDRSGEANTLNNISVVYVSVGETRKALEKYYETLPIYRAVGDRRGEAGTLNNIGVAYRLLGETRKALDMFNEALPIRRAVGDRRGEAYTLNNIGVAYR